MKSLPSAQTARGLSLIEVLIALAIGSVLILGLVQVFSASRTAYQLSEGMARAQENARFAMDFLQRDIRMAGHYGCVNDQSHLQTAGALATFFDPAPTAANTGTQFPISVRGYDATDTAPGDSLTLGAAAAGWTPTLPTAITALGPSAGSDVIELRFLANEGVPIDEITNPTATTTAFTIIDADRWGTLTENGVATPTMFGVADCSYVDIFSVPPGNVSAATGTVTVNKIIDRYTPQPAGQTMLYRAESIVYYIKPGASGEPALWRARSANDGTYAGQQEELVEGIENMQLLFGLDDNPDLNSGPPRGFVSQHRTASAVTPNAEVTWRGVGQVQVGLLAASPNRASALQSELPRTALGVSFQPPATDDAKYRASYEATIALRNRLYGN